jgi:glycosyltransferase involved in cell wall biosynthesis
MADRVTFVSKSSYHAFPKAIRRRREGIIRVIQNGVDVERIDQVLTGLKKGQREEVEDDFSRPSRPFKLLTVGRLIEQKNQRLLLEMLAMLPQQVSLTIVGQGILADELKAHAHQLGIERRLHFTGLIPRDEVFRRMQTANVFVSTSFWEGLPVAVLEAMAARMPVVLSEIDPHRELAQQGASVELLPFDVYSWAERIAALSQLPKDQLKALGDKNRKIVEDHFSLRRMQADYTKVYEELWGNRQRGEPR